MPVNRQSSRLLEALRANNIYHRRRGCDSPRETCRYSIFLIQLFTALAELESNHCSERIKAGLSVAKNKGVKLGRPLDQKKRAQLLKWSEAKVPVKQQDTLIDELLSCYDRLDSDLRAELPLKRLWTLSGDDETEPGVS